MKKANLYITLLSFFLLNIIPVFSQNSGFSSLDPLGPEYGNINQPRLDPISMEPFEGDRIKMPEINFPKSSQPSVNSNTRIINQSNNSQEFNETRIYTNDMSAEEKKAAINKHISDIVKSNETKDSYSKLSAYNTEELNYDRFKNSPCFEKIGFNPTWDMTTLENEYSDCEHEQQGKTVSNITFVIMFLILIAVVIFFSLSKEKRTQLISKIIKIT
jgi:hypothetical protein